MSSKWACSGCGEQHEDQFLSCWNCGYGKDRKPPGGLDKVDSFTLDEDPNGGLGNLILAVGQVVAVITALLYPIAVLSLLSDGLVFLGFLVFGLFVSHLSFIVVLERVSRWSKEETHQLGRWETNQGGASKSGEGTAQPARWPITDQLDVRGFSPAEISRLIPLYLQCCRDKGLFSVELIHGESAGVGFHREVVHSVLGDDSLVESFQADGGQTQVKILGGSVDS